jgi:hypothetical protein
MDSLPRTVKHRPTNIGWSRHDFSFAPDTGDCALTSMLEMIRKTNIVELKSIDLHQKHYAEKEDSFK